MNNIKKARLTKGLGQKEVAAVLNVAQPTISAWESGSKAPSNKNLIMLSELLEVSVDYLLGTSDIPTPQGTKKETSGLITPEDVMEMAERQKGRPLTADERAELLVRANDLRATLMRLKKESE